MKPVPFYDGISDGRSSFGFSWSLLSSFLLPFSLSLSLFLSLSSPVHRPPLCRPAPSLKPVVFSPTRNTGPRKRYTLANEEKRREPETFCYFVSIYRSLFERIRVTREFVTRIDNCWMLRKIRLKRVIRGSKLSVVSN